MKKECADGRHDLLKSPSIELKLAILDRIHIPGANQPNLLFVKGPCRTGTGAVATTIGRADDVAAVHIQPIKAIGRKFLIDREGIMPMTELSFEGVHSDLTLNPGRHTEVIKETFGPDINNPAEFLDPVSFFLEKDLPAKNMTIVPMSRDPLEIVISWKIMWKIDDLQNFPFDGFNESFRLNLTSVREAQQNNIKVVPYIHELLRDLGAEHLMGKMFKLFGFDNFGKQIIEWGDEDAYWTKNVKYDIPPKRWIAGALGKKSGGRGGLFWEPIQQVLSPEEIEFVKQKIAPSIEIHEEIGAIARDILQITD